MARRININADMGEGWGAYDIGDDAALLTIVKSANIACGFHGGDASVMRRTLEAAGRHGVSIGAHPGFDDLWGFGRRQIRMSPEALEHQIAYQIGAMLGMARYAGQTVTHVKAHGALNNMACVDRAYADAIMLAQAKVAPDLIALVMPGTEMEAAARAAGLRLGREAFVDRTYEDDGTLTPRTVAGSVIKDPTVAAERVVRMVLEETIVSRHGTPLPIGFDSLCVHGDEPTSVAVARAARAALEGAGVEIVTLPQMLAQPTVPAA
ncbi:MAG: 5-oxoprolinase subunit PxpA [Pseudomonadota bacterium]